MWRKGVRNRCSQWRFFRWLMAACLAWSIAEKPTSPAMAEADDAAATSASTGANRHAVEPRGRLVFEGATDAAYELGGFVGRRVRANVDRWLVVAPANNPGLLDMFARRDSGERPDLVPWAGEFVGKYLISGVQALRMSRDATLKETLRGVVERLVALQADDGYLGPWPKNERLLGHWDLWGHYHVMLGLMLWHEHTGDEQAAVAARRIADLVCDTFLDTGVRVFDAGSHEMNMAIITGMARIYRKTGNPRYLRMAKEVLADFERAGDYYRTGLAGKEFHRTPRPRWESLHCLQGLAELYQITGDESYRTAFLHHWASIRRFDLRNTGGFSSGEKATGNPYRNDAIETCCVVAWQEVMIDALCLTGEATIADDLELATLNAMLGAQHPSGAWCTYNTPMAGQRIPSHIDIRFQARPDTPHLNCCSVNGPRGYGSISRWGLMRGDGNRLVVNYYGPMQATVKLDDGTTIRLAEQTEYPVGGEIRLKIDPGAPRRFTVALRIPAWSEDTQVCVNGENEPNVRPGRYLELCRIWRPDDVLTLRLDMRMRYEAGDLEQYGNVSLYRGPILLAWDNRFNKGEPPTIDVAALQGAQLVTRREEVAGAARGYEPWLAVDVPTGRADSVRLIDFASAGATTVEGEPISHYTTWLPARNARPPRPVAWLPPDRAVMGQGAIRFAWRKPASGAVGRRHHTVVVSETPTFDSVALRCSAGGEQRGLATPAEQAARLKPDTTYYWKIVASNAHGQTESIPPHKRFRIDPTAPRNDWPCGERAADGMLVEAPLRGAVKPLYGSLLDARGWTPAQGPDGNDRSAVETDGQGGLIRYRVLEFPEQQFTVAVWVSVVRLPETFGHIFSAWTAGMDDPLRLFVLPPGKLAARIEAGRAYETEPVAIGPGRWYHVAAVKDRAKLVLYVDGQARASIAVPERVASAAEDFALGGNPHFHGSPEFLAARLADLRFYARALQAAEIEQLYRRRIDRKADEP